VEKRHDFGDGVDFVQGGVHDPRPVIIVRSEVGPVAIFGHFQVLEGNEWRLMKSSYSKSQAQAYFFADTSCPPQSGLGLAFGRIHTGVAQIDRVAKRERQWKMGSSYGIASK
jgi:hypothetical protein